MARYSQALANGESHRRQTLVTKEKGSINGLLRTDRAFLFFVNGLCIKGADVHKPYFPNNLASRILIQIRPVRGTCAPPARGTRAKLPM